MLECLLLIALNGGVALEEFEDTLGLVDGYATTNLGSSAGAIP